MDRGTEGDANTLPAASCSQGDWLLSFIHDPEGPRSGCVASCGVPTQGQSALPSLAYYTLTGRDQTSKRHPNLCHSAPHPRMGGPLDIKGSEPVGASSENQPRTALPPLSLSLSPSIYLSLSSHHFKDRNLTYYYCPLLDTHKVPAPHSSSIPTSTVWWRQELGEAGAPFSLEFRFSKGHQNKEISKAQVPSSNSCVLVGSLLPTQETWSGGGGQSARAPRSPSKGNRTDKLRGSLRTRGWQ